LGSEGYSPAVLRWAVRQCQKENSFAEASADLTELAGVSISPSHLQRLSGTLGREWQALRACEVQAFRDNRLTPAHREPPAAAAVMVDGGRVRTRLADAGQGIHEPRWRESKVACLQSMTACRHAADPQPEPPRKFLDPVAAARLAAEVKSRAAPAGKSDPPRGVKGQGKPRRRRKRSQAPAKLVRTVIATLACSEAFGWEVAAEVMRRGLHLARVKGYVCDGQKYNWSIHEMHLRAWGFIAVLDFVHLLAYLHGAAQAAAGKGTKEAWALYERWLRWAWSGDVKQLRTGLQAAADRLGEPPEGRREDDPRELVREALVYVRNNQQRMDYPRYRRLGLPISSASVESTIKRLNRRVKASEKFWLNDGAEAMLQLRAAHLSEDETAQRYWAQPRPEGRAVGEGRLRPVPA
jgi:hypothetical protein